MITISSKKQIVYLSASLNIDKETLLQKKKQLAQQGFLVVTYWEGSELLQKGIEKIIQNHLYPSYFNKDESFPAKIKNQEDNI